MRPSTFPFRCYFTANHRNGDNMETPKAARHSSVSVLKAILVGVFLLRRSLLLLLFSLLFSFLFFFSLLNLQILLWSYFHSLSAWYTHLRAFWLTLKDKGTLPLTGGNGTSLLVGCLVLGGSHTVHIMLLLASTGCSSWSRACVGAELSAQTLCSHHTANQCNLYCCTSYN